jgi:hypothetical protein
VLKYKSKNLKNAKTKSAEAQKHRRAKAKNKKAQKCKSNIDIQECNWGSYKFFSPKVRQN